MTNKEYFDSLSEKGKMGIILLVIFLKESESIVFLESWFKEKYRPIVQYYCNCK